MNSFLALHVQVWDENTLMKDDLIGSTSFTVQVRAPNQSTIKAMNELMLLSLPRMCHAKALETRMCGRHMHYVLP